MPINESFLASDMKKIALLIFNKCHFCILSCLGLLITLKSIWISLTPSICHRWRNSTRLMLLFSSIICLWATLLQLTCMMFILDYLRVGNLESVWWRNTVWLSIICARFLVIQGCLCFCSLKQEAILIHDVSRVSKIMHNVIVVFWVVWIICMLAVFLLSMLT